MYLFVFYAPLAHVEQIKDAIFKAKAGVLGHYDRCCFQVQGKGQFRANAQAKPFIGQPDTVSVVDEYCVQCLCSKAAIADVIKAFKAAHPYETPAYFVLPTHTFDDEAD